MRVIGIDPGTRHCGYGVVESRSGSRLVWLAHGVLSPKSTDSLEQRLSFVYEGLSRVIAETKPTTCGVEEIFFAANVRSALTLGHARGVALLAAAQAGLPVSAYPPAVVKQSVVGFGRAEKQQVAKMVAILLGIPAVAEADAADALAIAITHATRANMPSVKLR
jgi:crossover junction endodeoxyribonuclease RuvC